MRASKRRAGSPSGAAPVEEGGQIVHVVLDPVGAGRFFRSAMAPVVVAEHLKFPGKPLGNLVPDIKPCGESMHQNKGRALALDLVVQVHTVDGGVGHGEMSP